jgi:hypothetical protein
MHRLHRSLPVIAGLGALALLAVLALRFAPAHRAAGLAGIADSSPLPPTPEGTITSPSGRVWKWNEVDGQGWVMPLDVRRPKPPRPLGKSQDMAEIRSLREQQLQERRVVEEYRVSPDDGHTQNETAIDADGATIVSAWHVFGTGTLALGVSRSTDGGHVWTGSAISGFSTTLTDPCVKAARGGRWYLSYLGSGGTGGSDYDVYVRRSDDDGATWAAPVAVTVNSTFEDKPYIAASGDDILIGFADFSFSPARIRAIRSTNGGASFDHSTVLVNRSGGGNGACPVIHPNGNWFVFWRDSYQDSLWVSHSTDRGLTWSVDHSVAEMTPLPNQLPPGFRMINIPSAAADPVTGAIVVVWNDQRFGNPDILSTRSVDGGFTWSEPIRVNDDTGAYAQFFPWLVFDPNGVAHVCWYDRREDGSKIDVYTASSTDAGASWGANVRVTPSAYTPALPWDVSTAFIGDYNGIAANAESVFPCYQDAREGNQDVYVAVLPSGSPQQVNDISSTPGSAGVVAAPSVFAQRVALRSASGAAGTIEIFSADGSRVRELRLDSTGRAEWDGRDATGIFVVRGVYFARLAGRPGPGVRLVKTI